MISRVSNIILLDVAYPRQVIYLSSVYNTVGSATGKTSLAKFGMHDGWPWRTLMWMWFSLRKVRFQSDAARKCVRVWVVLSECLSN